MGSSNMDIKFDSIFFIKRQQDFLKNTILVVVALMYLKKSYTLSIKIYMPLRFLMHLCSCGEREKSTELIIMIVQVLTCFIHLFLNSNGNIFVYMCSAALSRTYSMPEPKVYAYNYNDLWNAKYARLSFDASPWTWLKLSPTIRLFMKQAPG